jgi:hypothetical protein
MHKDEKDLTEVTSCDLNALTSGDQDAKGESGLSLLGKRSFKLAVEKRGPRRRFKWRTAAGIWIIQ